MWYLSEAYVVPQGGLCGTPVRHVWYPSEAMCGTPVRPVWYPRVVRLVWYPRVVPQ